MLEAKVIFNKVECDSHAGMTHFSFSSFHLADLFINDFVNKSL